MNEIQHDAIHSSAKKLNEMNRLADMGHFPPLVNAGATLNILITVTITWLIEPRSPQPFAPVVWIALGAGAEPSARPPSKIDDHASYYLRHAGADGLHPRPAQVLRLGICCGLGQHGVLGPLSVGGVVSRAHAAGLWRLSPGSAAGDVLAGAAAQTATLIRFVWLREPSKTRVFLDITPPFRDA